jgi:hypothetical protein
MAFDVVTHSRDLTDSDAGKVSGAKAQLRVSISGRVPPPWCVSLTLDA